MAKYSFLEIKKKLIDSIERGWEAELSLYINDKEYMIIIYKDHCSFQRCGYKDGSGEFNFKTLDELYKSDQIDNINLKRDWHKITKFECFELEI